MIYESDSVDYTFTPENPIVVIFRFPYSEIDFGNSMVIENTHTFTLSLSGKQRGILEFMDSTNSTEDIYYELMISKSMNLKHYLINKLFYLT